MQFTKQCLLGGFNMKAITKKIIAIGFSILCASTTVAATTLTGTAENAVLDINFENDDEISQLSPEELFNYYMEVGEVPSSDDEDGISFYSIIGTDERTKVKDTTVSPYIGIGKLYMGASHSTCAAFAHNAVLTAAHCVYSGDHEKTFTKIEFGLNGNDACETITTKPRKIIVCPEYKAGDTSSENDWAIIYFDEKISNWCFGYSTGLSTSTQLITAGYPCSASADNNQNTGKEQYTCSGYASKIYDKYFKCDIDCTSGQSGSPIYNSAKHIVGTIHGGNSTYTTACRVKGELYKTMAAIRAGTYTPST